MWAHRSGQEVARPMILLTCRPYDTTEAPPSTNRDADQANPNCQPYYKSFSPGLTPAAAAAALEVEARRFRPPQRRRPSQPVSYLRRHGVSLPLLVPASCTRARCFEAFLCRNQSLCFLALMRRFRRVACDLASFLM